MIDYCKTILAQAPWRIILSNPRNKTGPCRKIVLTRHEQAFLVEKQVAGRLVHERLPWAEHAPLRFICEALSGSYRQLDAWTAERVYTLKISKKGKAVLSHAQNRSASKAPVSGREKRYILSEGTPIPPLVDLGVFTPEGKVAAPMQHKYRQINRFLEMLADTLPEDANPLTLVDYGCGKSYLTFMVYYYLTVLRGLTVNMTGLDLKPEVIEQCRAAAKRYGYDGLTFAQGDIASHSCAGADMVISLHACDTATDHALFHAIQGGVRVILAAPCCQHELNGQMAGDLTLLTRYGVVRERAAALMTDAIRANMLAYCGYRTQLMEFVDLTHTPKNLLLRAVKTAMPPEARETYLAEAEALCRAFGFKPTIMRQILMNGEQMI